jgi:hypothetical protein
MPTLDWIGKKAVENHHNQVPFHLLKEDSKLSFNGSENGKGNLLTVASTPKFHMTNRRDMYFSPKQVFLSRKGRNNPGLF